MGQTSLVCFGTGFLVYHARPKGVSQDLLDSLFQGEDQIYHGVECWGGGVLLKRNREGAVEKRAGKNGWEPAPGSSSPSA